MDKYTKAFNSMGDSGIDWIDAVFRVCVYALVDLSELVGISYEAINIWIFIIIQPTLILLFFILWRIEKRKNN